MLNKYIKLATETARRAGAFLNQLSDVKAASLNGKDIKLYADKESEKIILAGLEATGIPILSEESTTDFNWSGGLRWIIDPIDGSYNLFKGMRDLCCVSIALWDDQEPVFGIVYRFNSDSMYLGVVGQGATLNEESIAVSTVSQPSQASLATGFPVTTDFSDPALTLRLESLKSFKKVRMLGSAALMCSFVAQGCVDVYSERGILLWDIAGALALVKAAGGSYDCAFMDNYKCNVAAYANKALQASLKGFFS